MGEETMTAKTPDAVDRAIRDNRVNPRMTLAEMASRAYEEGHAAGCAERERMVEALDRLAGEVSGGIEMARECIGNTNAHVLWRKVQAAYETLKAAGVDIDDRKLVRAMVGSGDYREEEARAALGGS